jgi:signal peptidase I
MLARPRRGDQLQLDSPAGDNSICRLLTLSAFWIPEAWRGRRPNESPTGGGGQEIPPTNRLRLAGRVEAWENWIAEFMKQRTEPEAGARDKSRARYPSFAVSATEAAAIFEDVLESGSGLRVRVSGGSMSPSIEDGDVVTIRRVRAESLRRGDVVFFKSGQGTPVLHRIVRKRRTCDGAVTFQTKGDALFGLDAAIHPRAVLGKVCAIEKPCAGGEGKRVNLESPAQKAANFLLAFFHLARWGVSRAGLGWHRVQRPAYRGRL